MANYGRREGFSEYRGGRSHTWADRERGEWDRENREEWPDTGRELNEPWPSDVRGIGTRGWSERPEPYGYGQYQDEEPGRGWAPEGGRREFSGSQRQLGRQGRYGNEPRRYRSGSFSGSEFGGPMQDRPDEPMGRDYAYGSAFGTSRGRGGQFGTGRESGSGYSEYPNETREYRGSFAERGEGRGRFAGKGPKGYQRNDERIKEDINEDLTQHPDLDATEIMVQVRSGEVTLTGTVDDRQSKRIAEEIAERVSGVKDVQNQIRVGSGQERGQSGQQSEQGYKESERGKSRSGQTVGT
jgi:hypothetical protein